MTGEEQLIGRLTANEQVAGLQILGRVFDSFLFKGLRLSIRMGSVSQRGFPIQEVFASLAPTTSSEGLRPAIAAA
jgi:hypothetical protein